MYKNYEIEVRQRQKSEDSPGQTTFVKLEDALAVFNRIDAEYLRELGLNDVYTIEVNLIEWVVDEGDFLSNILNSKTIERREMENQTCGHCQAVGVFLGLSRKDNKTILCPDCSQAEGLEEYKNKGV